ncbi:MAG: lipopolysaccharide kinase InaA family protein, partial [Verrucomicrobiota bacterium]
RPPPPIGFSRNTFRSCFIPGKPLSILSPLGVEPIERNISLARECETTFLIGLWHLLESVFAELQLLHEAGMAHGDLFLHNVIVSLSPIKVFLIDFEQCVELNTLPKGKSWEGVCAADEEEILKQAVFVQCTLGEQQGALAERSKERLADLFGSNTEKFEKAMKLAATSQTPAH